MGQETKQRTNILGKMHLRVNALYTVCKGSLDGCLKGSLDYILDPRTALPPQALKPSSRPGCKRRSGLETEEVGCAAASGNASLS